MKTDSPIKLEKDDLLKRYPFAQDLIKGLLVDFVNGQDSIVIGINGEWGSGKSSLLEFLKSEIIVQTKEEPFRNYIFEFNPWRILNQDDLQMQFLKELGTILGNYDETNEEIKTGFNKWIDIFKNWNKSNFEPNSKIAISALAGILTTFTKEKSLITLKKEADERLEDNNIKLFVLIDDIDRLTPKEITEVFQLIKLNANFKNTYYFVAFDKNVVIKALINDYGENGEKYLEKIVQIDYTIPSVPNEVISKIFSQEINIIIAKLQLDIELELIGLIWDKHLKNYFTTIRHIYRFCKGLELRLPPIQNDIDFLDFLLIEAIRLFDYNSYEWVSKNSKSLTIDRVTEMSLILEHVRNKAEDLNKEMVDLINTSPELNRASPTTKNILKELFSLNFNSGYEILKNELSKSRKIASNEYFEHYFSFRILATNVPYIDYKRYIEGDSEDRIKLLNKYKEKNLFHKFIEGLMYSVQKHFKQMDFKCYYNELLDYCDNKLYNYTTEYFNQGGWFVIVNFLNELSSQYPKEEGYENLIQAFLEKENSFSRYLALAFINNKISKRGNFAVISSIPDSVITKYEPNITIRFKESLLYFSDTLKDNSLDFEEYTIIDILHQLYLIDEDRYNSLIYLFMIDDNKAILLFKWSLTRLNSNISLEMVVGYSILNNGHILAKLTIENFEKRLSEIVEDDYQGSNKEYLKLFYLLKSKEFDPKLFFTLDGREVPNYF